MFREEAASAAADNLHGKIIALPKMPHIVILSFIMLWVLLVAIWLVTGSFARKETAQGWLESKNGIVKIYADRPSKVAQVFVQEGQEVEQGQVLLVIHDLDAFGAGKNIKDQLMTELNAQKERIRDQLLREQDFLTMRKQRLHDNQQSALRDHKTLALQVKNAAGKQNILRQHLKRADSLVTNKFISKQDYEQILLSKLEAENEHNNYSLRLSAKQSELDDYERQTTILEQEHKNTLDRMNSELSNLTQSITQMSNRYVTTINAPKAGIITNLQTDVGQQLRGDELLLSLGDTSTELEMIILMPIRAAGFLQEGQALSVRYDSFPHEKFGLHSAVITDVSPTVLLANDLSSSPVQVGSPVYKVTAQTETHFIAAYGKEFPLKQGMTLTANITLENRSLAAWLLEPIISLRGRL